MHHFERVYKLVQRACEVKNHAIAKISSLFLSGGRCQVLTYRFCDKVNGQPKIYYGSILDIGQERYER